MLKGLPGLHGKLERAVEGDPVSELNKTKTGKQNRSLQTGRGGGETGNHVSKDFADGVS